MEANMKRLGMKGAAAADLSSKKSGKKKAMKKIAKKEVKKAFAKQGKATA